MWRVRGSTGRTPAGLARSSEGSRCGCRCRQSSSSSGGAVRGSLIGVAGSRRGEAGYSLDVQLLEMGEARVAHLLYGQVRPLHNQVGEVQVRHVAVASQLVLPADAEPSAPDCSQRQGSLTAFTCQLLGRLLGSCSLQGLEEAGLQQPCEQICHVSFLSP